MLCLCLKRFSSFSAQQAPASAAVPRRLAVGLLTYTRIDDVITRATTGAFTPI